jgi:poly(hydroxyalkanoate) synthase III subunit E
VKAAADADAWLGEWRRFADALAGGAGSAATGRAPLEQAGAAFAHFAAEFAALARPPEGAAAAARTQFAAQLRALAERFVTTSFPPWPTPPGADPEWARALAGWNKVLAEIAHDAAQRFAARLAAPDAPASLRATFDAWIDAAEAAFQASAFSDAFVAGQTRLINEFVIQRGRQQELIERAARAAGLPTRTEVDALHDALRALAPAPAAAAPAAKVRSSTARPVSARRASKGRRKGRRP